MIVAPTENLDKLRSPLIKDVFLVFRPAATWDRIASEPPKVWFVLLFYLLPVMALAALLEGSALVLTGRREVMEGMNNRFTPAKVLVFEVAQWLLMFLFMLISAVIIRNLANTHHQRNRLVQSLVLVFQAMGPMLLVQLFNGFPGMYLWLTWLVGLALTINGLYHGLPRMLIVDPPTAMGLFFSCAIVMGMLLFIGRFLTYWYLIGKFYSLEAVLSGIAAKLPF